MAGDGGGGQVSAAQKATHSSHWEEGRRREGVVALLSGSKQVNATFPRCELVDMELSGVEERRSSVQAKVDGGSSEVPEWRLSCPGQVVALSLLG